MLYKRMYPFAKFIIRKSPFYDAIQQMRYGRLYWQLEKSGNLTPPSYEVKRLTILLYAKLYQLGTLIETGTYLGDTADSLKSEFEQIYSIELQPDLYQKAKERFANYPSVSIIYGDSGEILPEILHTIQKPCLFWLDGHYSCGNTAKGVKETPIIEELNHILSHPTNGHVILIDDARQFNGYGDYPTLDQIQRIVRLKCPNCFLDVQHDVVRIHNIRR